MDEKEKFLKIYSNIPMNLRDDIVAVIDGKPVTWNVAFVEISNNSEIGTKILNKLLEMEII